MPYELGGRVSLEWVLYCVVGEVGRGRKGGRLEDLELGLLFVFSLLPGHFTLLSPQPPASSCCHTFPNTLICSFSE